MFRNIIKKLQILILVSIVALTSVIGSSTVSAGTDNSYEDAKNYIQFNTKIGSGFNNGTNNYNYIIGYNEADDTLYFEFDSYKGATQEERNLTLRVDTNPYFKGKASITMEYEDGENILKATAKCNLMKLKSSKNITFKIVDSRGKNYSSNRKIQKHLRTVFDVGMACCDSVLYEEKGYHLRDIGIEKYKYNIGMIIHHDGDYTCCGCGAHFTTQYAVNAHCEQDINCAGAGWTGSPGWNEDDTSWDEILNALSKAGKKSK